MQSGTTVNNKQLTHDSYAQRLNESTHTNCAEHCDAVAIAQPGHLVERHFMAINCNERLYEGRIGLNGK